MTFRLVISKATRLKMWSCALKVWFEKWRRGRIFAELWNQLQTSFSRALARPSALGWKPRKVVIQSTHQGLWRSLPWLPFCGTQKQVVGAFIWSPVLGILIWRRQYSLQMHWPARVHVENKVKSLCKEWLGISDNQWQVTWERRQVAFPKLKSTTWNFHLRRRSFRNELN